MECRCLNRGPGAEEATNVSAYTFREQFGALRTGHAATVASFDGERLLWRLCQEQAQATGVLNHNGSTYRTLVPVLGMRSTPREPNVFQRVHTHQLHLFCESEWAAK